MNGNPSFEVKILDERLKDWGLPAYQSAGAAGIDLYACLDAPLEIAPQASATLVPTGLSFNMGADAPVVAFVLPRSGLGHKKGLVLGNGTGVIDADYQGQIFVSAWNRNPNGEPIVIAPGERFAQLVFLPILRPLFEVVSDFSAQTERGAGGFGSTGIR